MLLSKKYIHWTCNLACSALFAYIFYDLLLSIQQDFQISNFLALSVSAILFFTILFRPQASLGRFDFWQILVCCFSLSYILLFDYNTPTTSVLSEVGSIILSVSLFGWSISCLWLGNSFSILPAVRQIKVNGPYALIRHPIYASYILMDLGLLLSYPSLFNFNLILVGICSYLLRMHFEERLLAQKDDYIQYSQQTKYKLIPFVC